MRQIITLLSILILGSSAMATNPTPNTSRALFGGGCFWCMQPAFDATPGVSATRVGYAGGDANTAHYEAVSTGTTGHVEVIQVTYDPSKIAYEKLLETYLENIDPTDPEGQFADKGSQYQAIIYYADEAQKAAAQQALAAIATKFSPAPIAIQLKPASPFYAAEEHHQKYYLKNKAHYDAYKIGSGRAGYIERVWKK